MKRTIRKIAIVLSMGMMLVLLTSWYSYALQLSSGLAVGIVINPNNQQQIPPEDNGNIPKESGNTSDTTDSAIKDTTVDMLRQKKDKALSDTSIDVDKEQIQQEIQDNVQNLDDNDLLKLKSSPEELITQASKETKNVLESYMDEHKIESSLQALVNRTGVTLNIEDTDNIIISYVHAGKTYATSTDISPAAIEKLQALFNRTFVSGTSGPAIGQIEFTTAGSINQTDGSTSAAFSHSTDALVIKASTSGVIGEVSGFVISSHQHRYSNGVCVFCDKACENPYHTDACPKCGLYHDNSIGHFGFVSARYCFDPFHSAICPDCGMTDSSMTTGSVISQGHPEIVFGIGGLVIGFFAAMLVFRKKNSTLSSVENKANERVENNDTAE